MRKVVITAFILLLTFTYSLNTAHAEGLVSKSGFKKLENPAVTELEPNNTKETANRIQPSDSVLGTIQDDEDTDYYRLVMPRKGQYTLLSLLGNYYSDNERYSDDYSITIYDENDNTVANSESLYDEDYGYFQGMQTSLEAGTYYISVKTNGYSYMNNQEYYLWQYIEYAPDFVINSLTANLPSPQIERKTITVQAGANKAGLHYQFSVQGKVVKSYSGANTYQWTPTAPGTYKLKVEVRDPSFPSAVAQKEISYTITAYKPDFAITSFSPNINSPSLTGKTITFSTKTNKSGLQYQYTVNGRVVQSFGANSSYSWKPTSAGKYTIKVEVRRSQYPNRIVSKQLSYEISDGKVYISSLRANMSSPRPTSTSIKWTAAAKGVNLEYKFSVYQNKKWTTIQNYSSKNYTYWKPKSAGSSKVMVTVRSKLSKKTATRTANFTIFKPSYFSAPTLKSNISTKQTTNTYFYFTAKSSGNYLEYRFRVYNGYYWSTVQDYSSSKSLYWTAYYKGKYTVAVDVRQKGTKTVKTKKLSLDIRESPNSSFNANYDIYYNYGYLKVTNYGYSNLKVTKMQFLNNGNIIYTHNPNNWITIGRSYQTYYFNPKKAVSQFSYNTVIKVYYTYDGLTYTSYLYR
ncbi:hypothetical protein [Neobacillus soli]|uniref:hypothetical protein n=1 Tax=Neobacillus soli TaxID=220688 RepID=UPI00082605BD|nr:hypothetical protein [Neobacillus soli]